MSQAQGTKASSAGGGGGGGKEQKMQAVAQAAMELLWKVGPNALTVSRLARASKVSRPWIYKYLGEDPVVILQFAIDTFAQAFAEFDFPLRSLTRETWATEQLKGLVGVMKDSVQYPWIIGVYMRYKGTPTPIGERIEKAEKKYLAKAQKEAQAALGLSPEEALRIAELTVTLKLALANRWTIQKTTAFQSIEEFERVSAPIFESLARSGRNGRGL